MNQATMAWWEVVPLKWTCWSTTVMVDIAAASKVFRTPAIQDPRSPGTLSFIRQTMHLSEYSHTLMIASHFTEDIMEHSTLT